MLCPGGCWSQALSNTKDKGGVTGMALYNNKGEFITSYAMPLDNGGDGYGYDLAVNPRKNALLTSSFTGYNNYYAALRRSREGPGGDESVSAIPWCCGTQGR